jgi:integrase
MQAWLAASGIRQGALFRRIRKGGHLGEPLAPTAVRDIVKERCALAGVEGPFSAHSLRAGVTEAGKWGISALKAHSKARRAGCLTSIEPIASPMARVRAIRVPSFGV